MITFNKLGRYGRLGNQMFQIASTIGIARKNGYEVGFPEWKNWDAKERFGSDEDIDMVKYFPKFREYVRPDEERPKMTNWVSFGYHDFSLFADNYDIEGHMQSEKYFKHCEGEIRELFELDDMEIENHEDFCSLHIRLGDYSDQAGYHPICSKEYYEAAINEIGANKRFEVFSDDLYLAKAKLREWFDSKYEFEFPMYSYTHVSDLGFIAASKNHICSNSTFSWWGAWLSPFPNKKVIMPSNWFGPAWTIPMPTKDIYFENVIVI